MGKVMEIVFPILLIIGVAGLVVGGVYINIKNSERWAEEDRQTCKQIASLAGSNDWKTDDYGNCFFVKDGKLQEIKDN